MPHELYEGVRQSDVAGLDDALDGKAPAGHTHPELGGGGFASGAVPAGSLAPSVTHGLGTRDVNVTVREVATDLIVPVAAETADDNTVTFTFRVAPAIGQYRYLIIAGSPATTTNLAAHGSSHAVGGSDPIAPAAIGAATSGHSHDLSGYVPSSRQVSAGAGLSGGGALSADRSLAVAYGSSAGTACQGDDARLSNARIPTAHAATHAAGGGDAITPGDIAASPRRVRTRDELADALTVGGDVLCDSSVTIALTSTMLITQPTRLLGGRFTRATGEAFRITSSNVEITGATIIGGGGSEYDETQKLVRAVGAAAGRLTGINIHDNAFFQSRGDCVWLDWCDGAQVTGNTMRQFLYSGVMVVSGLRCRVANNDIADAPLSNGVVNTYGIAFTDVDNTLAARSVDCSATGNVISLIDWEGIDTHGGDSIVVSGNIITACPRGVAIITGNTSRVTAPQRCVVTGNRIDGTGMRQAAREGVIVAGISGKPTDAVVTGNTIDNNGTAILLDIYDRAKTYVGGNSEPQIPWTNIPLDSGVVAHATLPAQYMFDGNVVYLRGAIYRSSSGMTADVTVGTLPAACWPTALTWFSTVKAANAAGGFATWLINTNGVLTLGYATVFNNTTHAWPLNGDYRIV